MLSEHLRKIQPPVTARFNTLLTPPCFFCFPSVAGRGRPRPGRAVGTGRYGMPLMPRPAAGAMPPSASARQSARPSPSPCPVPPHASRPAYQRQGIRLHAKTSVMMAGGPKGRRKKSRTGLPASLRSSGGTCSTRDTCVRDSYRRMHFFVLAKERDVLACELELVSRLCVVPVCQTLWVAIRGDLLPIVIPIETR